MAPESADAAARTRAESPGAAGPAWSDAKATPVAPESADAAAATLDIEVVADRSLKGADAECAVTPAPRRLRLRVRASCPDKPRVWVTMKAANEPESGWTDGPRKYSPEGDLIQGKWSDVFVPIPASMPRGVTLLSLEFLGSCVSGETLLSKRGTTKCRLPSL